MTKIENSGIQSVTYENLVYRRYMRKSHIKLYDNFFAMHYILCLQQMYGAISQHYATNKKMKFEDCEFSWPTYPDVMLLLDGLKSALVWYGYTDDENQLV